MPKTISAYRGYTSTAIYNRADIPDAADMSISGSNVNCNNIATLEDVASVLGTSVKTVGGLCTNANVNPWSGFGPTTRSVSNRTLYNSTPSSNYSLGSFAGYNHQAVAPGWIGSAPSGDIWINAGGNADFVVDVNVGEVKWHEVANGIAGVTLAIYYASDSGLAGWGSRNFNASSVQNDVTSLTATLSGIGVERTYYGSVWLVDNTAEFDDTQIVCRVPNTSVFTKTVKIKPASYYYWDATGNTTVPSPWGVYGGIGMNWSTGYFTIGQMMCGNNYSHVRVTAYLFDWLDNLIGSYTFWDGIYYPMDEITGSGYLGMTSIPTHGYRVRIDIAY